jgi:hypothetical protein
VGDLDIQYAAHTATCTFLLDGDGICRRVVMAPTTAGQARTREAARAAARCVGAQYVASLDPSLAGMLADMPKVGTAMLFARTDERGKISLVRTGHVARFERYIDDPFTAPDDRPSVVATSAPPLTASMAPTQRKVMLPPPDPYAEGERIDDRTKPILALRPSDFRKLRPIQTGAPTSEPPTLRTPNLPPPPPQPQRMRSDVAPKANAPIQAKPALRRRG